MIMKMIVFFLMALFLISMSSSCEKSHGDLNDLSKICLDSITLSKDEYSLFLNGGNQVNISKHTYKLIFTLKDSSKDYEIHLHLKEDKELIYIIKDISILYKGGKYGPNIFFDLDNISGYPLERMIIGGVNLKVSDTTNLLVKRLTAIGFEMKKQYGFTEYSQCFKSVDTLALGAFTEVVPDISGAEILEIHEISIPINKLYRKAKSIKALKMYFYHSHFLQKYYKESCKFADSVGISLVPVKANNRFYTDEELTFSSFEDGDTLLIQCE